MNLRNRSLHLTQERIINDKIKFCDGKLEKPLCSWQKKYALRAEVASLACSKATSACILIF